MATPYPVATMSDGRTKYSDGSIRGTSQTKSVQRPAQPAQNRTLAPRGSSIQGPNTYLNSGGTLTRVNPNTGAVTQGIPNTPQSQDTPNYPSTQQQADQFRAATSSQKPFDFNKFLSRLNPVKPVGASELPSSSPLPPISSSLGGTLTGDPAAEDRAALFKGLNPFAENGSFSDRIRNIVSGLTGAAGQYGNFGASIGDLGVSEFIRGSGAKKPVVGKQSYESSTPQATRSFEKPQVLASKLQNSSRMTDDGLVQGWTSDANTYNEGIKNTPDYSPASNTSGSGDWLLLDEEIQANRQNLEQQILNGELDEQEAIRKDREYTQQKLEAMYAALNKDTLAEIPFIEQGAQTQQDRLREGFNKFKESATPIISNIENTFGTAVRSAVENAQKAKTNLRNVYSSMGSAESSQFLDNFGDIEKSTGKSTAQLDLEKGQQIGGINTKVLDEETLTNQRIADIQTSTAEQVRKIKAAVDMNNLEKKQAIEETLMAADAALAEARAASRKSQSDLTLMDREALVNRQNLLTQGQIDSDLIYKQADVLNRDLMSSIPQVPPEVDGVIRGFLQAPQSGGSKYFQLQALKGRYPDLAELLDAVMGGRMTAQTYNTLGGSQGAGNYNFGF